MYIYIYIDTPTVDSHMQTYSHIVNEYVFASGTHPPVNATDNQTNTEAVNPHDSAEISAAVDCAVLRKEIWRGHLRALHIVEHCRTVEPFTRSTTLEDSSRATAAVLNCQEFPWVRRKSHGFGQCPLSFQKFSSCPSSILKYWIWYISDV